MDPSYVIMYHSSVSAIRQIEVHEARKKRSPNQRLKVFFLVHAQTVEEQSYLTSLRREKQAFELIIDTKSVRIVCLESIGLLALFEFLNFEIVENGHSRASRW